MSGEAVPTEADTDTTPLKHDETGDLEFSRLDELNRDWDDHFNEEHRGSRASMDEEGDRKLEAMANMPDRPPSLQDYLADQLGEMELEEDARTRFARSRSQRSRPFTISSRPPRTSRKRSSTSCRSSNRLGSRPATSRSVCSFR
jgi:hypothetical protein